MALTSDRWALIGEQQRQVGGVGPLASQVAGTRSDGWNDVGMPG